MTFLYLGVAKVRLLPKIVTLVFHLETHQGLVPLETEKLVCHKMLIVIIVLGKKEKTTFSANSHACSCTKLTLILKKTLKIRYPIVKQWSQANQYALPPVNNIL